MFILGSLCFLLLGGINEFLPWELGFVWQMLIGAGIVTILELIFGIVVNVWLDRVFTMSCSHSDKGLRLS